MSDLKPTFILQGYTQCQRKWGENEVLIHISFLNADQTDRESLEFSSRKKIKVAVSNPPEFCDDD